MSWLTREQVKGCVETALREVADWSGEIDEYRISELSDRHQISFMKAIVRNLKASGFTISLTHGKLQGFGDIGTLIDYIEDNQARWARKPEGYTE